MKFCTSEFSSYKKWILLSIRCCTIKLQGTLEKSATVMGELLSFRKYTKTNNNE